MSDQDRWTTRDPLTGLPDRAALLALTDAALEDPRHQPAIVAIRPSGARLLDQMTCVDTDAVMVDLSVRLRACLRPDDQLARIGDVTFAILTAGDRDAATGLVRTIMRAVEPPIRTTTGCMHLPVTAGVAVTDLGTARPDAVALLQHASIALSTVATNPGTTAVFTPRSRNTAATWRCGRPSRTRCAPVRVPGSRSCSSPSSRWTPATWSASPPAPDGVTITTPPSPPVS